jgi:hypothetical protein
MGFLQPELDNNRISSMTQMVSALARKNQQVIACLFVGIAHEEFRSANSSDRWCDAIIGSPSACGFSGGFPHCCTGPSSETLGNGTARATSPPLLQAVPDTKSGNFLLFAGLLLAARPECVSWKPTRSSLRITVSCPPTSKVATRVAPRPSSSRWNWTQT